MSQTVETQFGTGTVVDYEAIRGRLSYKVEGPGFSTWIEATAMPVDFEWMPHPDDIQNNSVTLPYNPSPQTWVNPTEQNIVPGRQGIDPDKRTSPADSVDLQEDGESYEPGPDPRLFATGGLSPEDIQAKLGPKYVNAFVEHDFSSLQARIDENPELVMAEARERVAELVAQADQDHLERVGRNEYLEASDPQIREAAWKDVRAKAVRLRHSGQVMTRAANPDIIATQVTGDHGTYEVTVIRSNIFQGSSAVDSWTCECPWGQWAFKREHTFVGRLCSHAYASLLELQAMTQSKTPNPRFRNSPGIGFDPSTLRNRRRQSSVDQYEVGDKAFAHGIGATYVIEKDGAGYLVRDMNGGDYFVDDSDLSPMDPEDDDHEYWGHLSSRTAESMDVETVIDYARDNVYDTLAENGLDIHDPEAYDLIQETWRSSLGMYEDMYGLDIPEEVYNRYASRTAEMVDIRPVGWDPYSRSLMNQLRTLWDEGSRPGRQKERNEEVRELVQELRDRGFATDGIMAARESFIDRPLGYGDIPDYGSSQDYILEHELRHREDVEEPEFEYPAGGSHGVVDTINDTGGEDRAASRTSAFLPKGTQVERISVSGQPTGLTGVVVRDYNEPDDELPITIRWDGDTSDSKEDVTLISWGEYEDGTPTKRLDDPWNIHGERTADVGWEEDYSGGDEFGGAEDPYYVDPVEREDYPEDDIVANFQRNAGWIMGNDSGGSGGGDDISAAAAAHLRTAGRNFTMAEQQALIDEDDGMPYDRSSLRLDGTHYL